MIGLIASNHHWAHRIKGVIVLLLIMTGLACAVTGVLKYRRRGRPGQVRASAHAT
jgi:hypothetical protein